MAEKRQRRTERKERQRVDRDRSGHRRCSFDVTYVDDRTKKSVHEQCWAHSHCGICGNCGQHCLRHYGIRDHLLVQQNALPQPITGPYARLGPTDTEWVMGSSDERQAA